MARLLTKTGLTPCLTAGVAVLSNIVQIPADTGTNGFALAGTINDPNVRATDVVFATIMANTDNSGAAGSARTVLSRAQPVAGGIQIYLRNTNDSAASASGFSVTIGYMVFRSV